MQFEKKYIQVFLGVLAFLMVLGAVFFATSRPKETKQQSNPVVSESKNSANNNASGIEASLASADLKQGVTPIDTKVGTVAGVDLNGLASDANRSASISAQDGVADASAISADSQAVGSITDSINNQIQ